MRGGVAYIKMKIRKVLFHSDEYMLAKKTHCKDVEFGYRCNVAYEADIFDSKIGKRTSVGRYTTIRNCDIGGYCAISWNCSLGAKNHHYERLSCSGAFYHSRFGLVDADIKEMEYIPPTVIGNDVWIGCNAVVVSGVTIGDGAVIGAGAIVTKDVEPYAIVVGVPGKCVGYRFEEDIRKNLLEAKWWLWEDDLLKENVEIFQQEMTKELSDKILSISKQL